MKHQILFLSLVLAFVVILSTEAGAVMYGFEAITTNGAGSPEIGEAQLSVDVTDAGGGQVLFTFINSGPAASSIAAVYFDDGSLLGIAGLIDADEGIGGDSGVDFSLGTGNLPSGNTASPPFVATAGFVADADPPPAHTGVNPSESLGIVFDLQSGMFFNDVLTDLSTGDLRIGIHVTSFANGASESFIHTPIPPSVLIGMIGMGIAGIKLRKYA